MSVSGLEFSRNLATSAGLTPARTAASRILVAAVSVSMSWCAATNPVAASKNALSRKPGRRRCGAQSAGEGQVRVRHHPLRPRSARGGELAVVPVERVLLGGVEVHAAHHLVPSHDRQRQRAGNSRHALGPGEQVPEVFVGRKVRRLGDLPALGGLDARPTVDVLDGIQHRGLASLADQGEGQPLLEQAQAQREALRDDLSYPLAHRRYRGFQVAVTAVGSQPVEGHSALRNRPQTFCKLSHEPDRTQNGGLRCHCGPSRDLVRMFSSPSGTADKHARASEEGGPRPMLGGLGMIRQTWCWVTTRHRAEPGRYCRCRLILAHPSPVQVEE